MMRYHKEQNQNYCHYSSKTIFGFHPIIFLSLSRKQNYVHATVLLKVCLRHVLYDLT
jgi:hypothetical protein